MAFATVVTLPILVVFFLFQNWFIVFWYAPDSQWRMVIAAHNVINIYSSPDLKNWTHLTNFGDFQGAHGGMWECPDLFPMQVDGQTKWVLLVSIGRGDPAGRSGTQYFVGNFDGSTFTNDNSASMTCWFDNGPDNYAGVTWDNTPAGSRIFMGWMNNWQYANLIPTLVWRGALTIPRLLTLKNI